MKSHTAPDLTELLARMVQASFMVQVDWRGSWARMEEALRALLDRRMNGKAVLGWDESAPAQPQVDAA